MWDLTHVLTIMFILFIYIVIFIFRFQLKPYRKQIRLFIGTLLILSRLNLDIWYVLTGTWSVQQALPIELCSIASLAVGIMLLTKNRFLFETFYFIGIAGAIQSFITLDLFFGFPPFRFLQLLFINFLLILVPYIMFWLYLYKITFFSLINAFLTIYLIAAIVFIIILLIDANYMFLIHKPRSTSLLDILGPYPYYLIALEGIVIIVFFILYLPFISKKQCVK